MSQINNCSDSLFNKLRNRFPTLSMGTEEGLTTTDPREARFFNFGYTQNGKNLGNITISIVNRQNLKVFYGQEITENMEESELNEWYRFLRELRRFAKSQIMTFDVRDITKPQLDIKDLNFLITKQKSKVDESKVIWQRRGNRSQGILGDTRIDVLHDDMTKINPHNRLLKVQKIYLKNPNDERFLLPFNSVLGAKAMANHVSRGGTPYDSTGVMICDSIAEAKKLQKFCRYAKRHQSNNPEVIDAAIKIKERIKEGLSKLTRPKVFDDGVQFLSELNSQIEPDEQIDLYDDISEDFKPCVESATRAYFRMKNDKFKRLDELSRLGNQINSGEFILNLRPDSGSEQIMKNSKFDNTNALLARVLRDIADRIVDNDEVRNFANTMTNSISDESDELNGEYSLRKILASKLAAKYIRGLKSPLEMIPESIIRQQGPNIIIGDNRHCITIPKSDAHAIIDLTQGELYSFRSLEGQEIKIERLENQYRFTSNAGSNTVDGPAFDDLVIRT